MTSEKPEMKSPESETVANGTGDDGSFFDDLIESVEEIVEAPVHFLFRKLGGKKD